MAGETWLPCVECDTADLIPHTRHATRRRLRPFLGANEYAI